MDQRKGSMDAHLSLAKRIMKKQRDFMFSFQLHILLQFQNKKLIKTSKEDLVGYQTLICIWYCVFIMHKYEYDAIFWIC